MRYQKPKQERLSTKDGNVLLIDGLEVYLRLQYEAGRSRSIATIRPPFDLVLKRDRDKHLFRKDNSYGINYALLHELPFVKWIVIRDNVGEFVITAARVKTCRLANHKFSGKAELQYFVPLTELTPV